MFVMQT